MEDDIVIYVIVGVLVIITVLVWYCYYRSKTQKRESIPQNKQQQFEYNQCLLPQEREEYYHKKRSIIKGKRKNRSRQLSYYSNYEKLTQENETKNSNSSISTKIICQSKLIVMKLNGFQYTHMVIGLHEIFYGNFFKSQTAFQNWNNFGYHYKVQYIEPFYNPKFEIYEGQFKNRNRQGNGTLFAQKSKNILFQGEWQENQQVEAKKYQMEAKQIEAETLEIETKVDEQKKCEKRIIIMENGVNLNDKPTVCKIDVLQTWIMYNQQISINDMKILTNSKGLFTSCIIDAFALYLNIEDERQYFSYSNYRQQINHKRVLFIPSDIFTSMTEGQVEKNKQIFHQHILEYEPIKFQIQMVFKRIYFIINKSFHWFLVQIDLGQEIMYIFDSMARKEASYSLIFQMINELFNNQLKKIRIVQTLQQSNGYDCGPFTCLNMVKQTTLQIKEKLTGPREIRKFLFNLVEQK